MMGFLLFKGMDLIESLYEKEVCYLFNDCKGIRDPSRPEDIPDPVDLPRIAESSTVLFLVYVYLWQCYEFMGGGLCQ
jgi:hypothetical protein